MSAARNCSTRPPQLVACGGVGARAHVCLPGGAAGPEERALNSSTLPHLRSLYDILEYRNCCSSDQRDAHAAVVKKAKGPGVTWVDEQQPKDPSSLSLGSLLSAPDWCL